METSFLNQPEGKIAYEVAGTGPLVVCIPGMGELRSSYRFTVPALVEAGLRVATMDLRGHGDSDATFTRYDDVAAAGDVIALIAELGGPAVVIGNSMGGGAAAWATAERPDLVSATVLVGAFVRNPPASRVAAWAFRLVTGGQWAVRAWASYLPKLYPGRRPVDFDEHVQAITASMRRPGRRQAFAQTTRTDHALVERRLDETAAAQRPVLVVMGEHDPDFPDARAEAEWTADRLGGDVVMVAQAGHYPQVEYPEIVNPAVVDFVTKVVGRA